MSRKPRLHVPRGLYHVMHRGNLRRQYEAIRHQLTK